MHIFRVTCMGDTDCVTDMPSSAMALLVCLIR